ncbi:hypothetical protein [Methylobacterium mesophilicum]|uniref:hypothetical protein n=1 Tax=Methylobacterium mesophilicum TaxID=39956 RepID=UPI001EE32FA1|nr:hypothetical protein [Methylobacterium mesophilicum]
MYTTGHNGPQALWEDPEAKRDIPMMFRWSVPGCFRDYRDLPWTGNGDRDHAIASILAEAMSVAGTEQRISVSLRREWYVRRSGIVGRGYTYQHVRGALESLHAAGWVHVLKGVAMEGGSGIQTTFWPTQKLVDLMGIEVALVYGLRDPIVMRGTDGQMMPVPDTRELERRRRHIERLNEAMRGIVVSLDAPDVAWTQNAPMMIDGRDYDPRRTQAHAVYNASTKAGGRLYGLPYQTLSNRTMKRRSQIRIDGALVDEPDFSGCHPRMLYHLSGLDFDGDLYAVSHPTFGRDEAKLATQILINASGEQSALLAFCYRLATQAAKAQLDAGGPRMTQAEVDAIAKGHRNGAKTLFEALKAKHAPISDTLFTGAGIRLQYEESMVMTAAAAACLSRGVVSLPMHDSAITKAGSDASLMREAMHDAYLQRIGKAPLIGGH